MSNLGRLSVKSARSLTPFQGVRAMRFAIVLALVLLSNMALLAGDEKARTITFSKDSLDKVPPGWKADHTGKDGHGHWKVVADDTAPSNKGHVLAQTGES